MSAPITSLFIQPGTLNVGIGTSQPRAKLEVAGTIVPSSNEVYDLGSASLRWRDLYLSGNSINLGGTTITRDSTSGGIKFIDPATNQPLDSTVRNLTASNLTVLGDYVTLNTITSNTEQMVIENAGTGPALKVTQTGAHPIADFYDDNNVLAMRIADGGNVGIGTANPKAELHVHGTGAIIIPSGTTAQQPIVSSAGMLRFNIDNGVPEFFSPSATAWIPLVKAPSFLIEYLVVAGGGGGGKNAGAGGGAGGYRTNRIGDSSGGGGAAESSLYGIIGTAYTLTIGSGGAGSISDLVDTVAPNGNNSVFSTITSIGGGGGTNSGGVGAAGGSGGGAGSYGSGDKAGGAGTLGQGFRGGNGTIPGGSGRTGAGGGGAGAIGQDSQTTTLAGNGGIGVVSTITGTSIYRGGGGGGGVHSGTGGVGGNGGGGSEGQAGTVNTGGGGGAGRSPNNGSAGGSGVIIIRVSSIYLATFSAGLTYTELQLGNSKVYNITSGSGTVNFI